MRLGLLLLLSIVIVAIIGLAIVRTRAEPFESRMVQLSMPADSILTTLAVSQPQTPSELSDNSAMYSEDLSQGIRQLLERDLVERLPDGSYRLSSTGAKYVAGHYENTRNGETTTVKKRLPENSTRYDSGPA